MILLRLRQRRLRQRHQQPQPPLRQRHQALRRQRRQLRRRPPAHRHVFAKSTAASAALRGCVPRWCSPHPRWRTPLWAEEVCADCACQHSTAGFVRVCCGPLYKIIENNDCVLLHLLLLPCCVLRVVPRIRHVERIADALICMALEPWVCFSFYFNFCFLIIVFYCFLNLWFAVRCASSAIVLIPSVSWCVRCCCWGAAICCCAVAVRGVAAVSLFLLPSLLTGSQF
ncbi:putative mucin TcMUCII [Trypanosoma cruzi]|uniref:Putative mucin TcMUCII n=1 Tax=Trypanosoma cruzi TaxID=5693 RepID=A0A7J6XJ10_TRYCR|nr:putative mucin TcMUCII [Trypanosoma cruzi]